MSLWRRAGAPRLIEWTGERCVPWTPDVQVVYEHFHRYLWAANVLGGQRRVLDLGSGEGFGAALLAEASEHVVGVDVDRRTVEHARLNYEAANLEFQVASATDLSDYETGSFGAVVAFEIIEHVREQAQVVAEVARVLADDGLLVISTPDRRLYSEATGHRNPFHERELGLEEFVELLGEHFPHVATWGQRTISGSHLNTLGGKLGERSTRDIPDFYVERSGEEWRIAGDPAALYVVALASKSPLPELSGTSTLADCDLELVRVKERDAVVVRNERDTALRRGEEQILRGEELSNALEREGERHARIAHELEARMHEELEQRDRDILRCQEDIVALRDDILSLEAEIVSREDDIASREADVAVLEGELAAVRQLYRRTEESVTWQAFQRVRDRLYGAIGDTSLLAHVLRLTLRLAGRGLFRSTPTAVPPASPVEQDTEAAPSDDAGVEVVSMPEYESPKVSLIIPLYAHAELTRACLQSIRDNTTHASYEVILVDDAADAETKLLLEGVRGVKIVRNEKNLGYLRSMNRGASSARGRWLVLFNNDTEVTRGWLSAMLACAESAEDVGIVTPKYIYPDGSLNEAGGIIWRDGTGANYGRGDQPDRFQYEYRRETDYGSAAALMVSVKLWRAAGGFDERYEPMYYEDADLCFEARELGMRVLYEPEAVVVHVEGASAGTDVEVGHKRFQERNRPKFVTKWRHRLDAEQLAAAPSSLRMAANRQRGPHILVIDHCVPTWDRDSGSLRMLTILQTLLGLGVRVTFMAENLAPLEPYSSMLQRMGIEILYGQLDVRAELAAIGPNLTAAILSRPHAASRWLDSVREFAPAATVAYDTVDLHWLREARRDAVAIVGQGAAVASNGDQSPWAISRKAEALRQLELAMVKAADVTLVVSESERAQLERDTPEANTLVIPNIHDVQQFVPSPESRKGLLFIGSFMHPPNVDSAIQLVKAVMPVLWRELRDLKVTIVGASPPPEVQALASPRVEIAGWIEDLQPLLDRSRLLVAPLRYGAGLKGKITQSLAAGLPVVTTSVGAEGIDGLDQCMLVGEDASQLAAHVLRLLDDDRLWRELSRAGQALIARHCSREVISARLGRLLESSLTQPAEIV
ncbi:MAG TPA: glycosyltransferase [Solirubrobacteraceae bacterium]|nr:glycosyltransferase [Solirubrobacteraceae bacterium]